MDNILVDTQQVLGLNPQSLQSTGEFGMWALIFGGLAIITVFLIIIIIRLFSYKHIVVLKNRTSGVPVTIVCKAKIITEKKSGLEKCWKLMKPNIEIPVPPDYAREQTNKGKLFVKAFVESDKGILYIVAKSKKNRVGKEDIEYAKLEKETVQKTDELFTTNNRIFYANQMRQADLEKGKTLMDIIERAVFPVLVIVLITMLMIFGPKAFESWNENIMEPMHEMMDDVHEYTLEVKALRGNINSICAQQQQQPEEERPD